MNIDILSLFPGYFKGPFDESILKRAQERGLMHITCHDLRAWSEDEKWNRVDERPFGGGGGMLLQPGPVVNAIRSLRRAGTRVIALSPQGERLTAAKARELAGYEHLVLVAGHYEGIDQRALDAEVDEEISIGDVVLTNGCLAAIVVVDSVARFVPGVLGNEAAAETDSFENGLLEGPQLTRPVEFEGVEVPPVLRGGDHKAVRKWRLSMALSKTAHMRPDLLKAYVEAQLPEAIGPRVVLWVQKIGKPPRHCKVRAKAADWLLLETKGIEIALMEGANELQLPVVVQLPEIFVFGDET